MRRSDDMQPVSDEDMLALCFERGFYGGVLSAVSWVGEHDPGLAERMREFPWVVASEREAAHA